MCINVNSVGNQTLRKLLEINNTADTSYKLNQIANELYKQQAFPLKAPSASEIDYIERQR